MKAEDVAELYEAAMDQEMWNGRFNGVWRNLNDDERKWLLRFARACEQHGIEKAKAKARVTSITGWSPNAWVDWRALDAEVEKENEDG